MVPADKADTVFS